MSELPKSAKELETLRPHIEKWLGAALTQPEPPAGLAAEILEALEASSRDGRLGSGDEASHGDRFALWSALTALTQEVKVEGRFFKQLRDTLSEAALDELPTLLREESRRLGDLEAGLKPVVNEVIAAQGRSRARDAQHDRELGKLVNVLCDVRDRLLRGVASARQSRQAALLKAEKRRTWLKRLFSRHADPASGVVETAIAIEESNVLALERLDVALADLSVEEVDCDGALLDPRKMKAVEIEETDDVDEGTILTVFRPGYLWGGKLLRPAEVKVARRPFAWVHEGPGEAEDA